MERTFAMADSRDTTELQAFKTVLYHSVLIIAMPVLSFFVSKVFLFDGLFGMQNVPSNVYAAVVAVLVLHLALGAFIYRAYFSTQAKAPAKID